MGFFGHFFSFFRRKSSSEHIEDQLEERRLRPRVNPREGTRVLVIDDSPTILTAMKRFLESTHCVFLGALDAKMGMEVALTQKPDMIFLDIVMPGINGFAALRALRKNSRTREIPIIMMSGNEQAKAQFFGAHIGADDFMKKPFSRFEVFARIARLLDTERVPRRLPGSGTSAPQPAEASPKPPEVSSSEEIAPQQAQEQPQAETSPAPPSAPPLSESPPVLTSVQIVEQPPVDAPQPEAVKEEPAVPIQAQPEPSTAASMPSVSAQVVSITQPSTQETPHTDNPRVSLELLTRIARLAHLAQSDPEALKALVVLAGQLSVQYAATASQGAVTQARATAT